MAATGIPGGPSVPMITSECRHERWRYRLPQRKHHEYHARRRDEESPSQTTTVVIGIRQPPTGALPAQAHPMPAFSEDTFRSPDSLTYPAEHAW